MSDKITGNKVGAPSVKLTGSLGLKNVNEIVETADSAAQAKASAKAAKESEIISSKNAVTAKSQATNAENSANSATASADNSSASAAASSSDAASATASADKSKASETAAKTSETAAKTSADKSKTSETAAKASADKSKASADKSKASEGASKVSADNSSASASASSTGAASATASADKAKASETTAKTSETTAKTSETAAKASETAAKTSETAAKASETAAKASETAAKTSADKSKASEGVSKVSSDNSSASETAAKASETAAKTSETAAKASADKSKASEGVSKVSSDNSSASAAEAKASADIASDSMNFKTETVSIAMTSPPRVEFIKNIRTFVFYMQDNNYKPDYQLPVGLWDMSNRELVSFERSTKAWWNGKEYGIDVPRYTKDGKLLIEGQSTNLAAMGKVNIEKFALTSSTVNSYLYTCNGHDRSQAVQFSGSALGLVAGKSYTLSCYLTSSVDAEVWAGFHGWNNIGDGIRVTLKTGVRQLVTCTVDAYNLNYNEVSFFDTDSHTVFSVDDTVFIENPQIENGLVATTYIPATSVAVTRTADIATVRDK